MKSRLAPDSRRSWSGQMFADEPSERAIYLAELSRRLECKAFKDLDTLRSTFSLCRQLATDPGRFDILVSDEASGRLVALLVKRVLDRIRGKQGLPPLALIFVNGGYMDPRQSKAVADFVSENADRLQRALIVTEYIYSGRSMERLLDIFAEAGLDPAVACVSIQREPKIYPPAIRDRIICGSIGEAGRLLYNQTYSTGVNKHSAKGAHPERYIDGLLPDEQVFIRESIRQARADVARMSEVFLRLLERKNG